MSLPDVLAAVVEVCTGLNLADQVLDEPPAKLPDDRTFQVEGSPGDSTLAAHHGKAGRTVYQADDEVLVTYALRAARDAMAETYPEILSVYLATRDAIFRVVKDGSLNGTITGFAGIRTDAFGALDAWLPDTAIGFQMALQVRHMTEAAAS